ncbi:MAG TPA: molybdopterin-binding protein [Nitrososphaeraceae archaeon]
MSKVEIVCIGNELLSGITLNTNANWMCKKITRIGGLVTRVLSVRDDVKEIDYAIKNCLERKPDWLITCGGLGPTYDDMTLRGVGRSLGRKLVLDSTAVQMIKDSYKKRRQRVKLTSARLKMALIPEGSIPILNPIGNAPAVQISIKKTRIVCLPGVPAEMKAIFSASILVKIKKEVGKFEAQQRYYYVEGVGEATLARTLTKLVNRFPPELLYLKTHPQGHLHESVPLMKIQIISKGKRKSDVEEVLKKVSKDIIAEVKKHGGKIKLK